MAENRQSKREKAKVERQAEKKLKKLIKRPKLPVLIPLEFPVKHGDEELSELTISKRMTVKDMRMVADCETKGDAMLEMLGNALGLPDSVIDQIDAIDLEGVMEALEDFLPSDGEKDGKKGWL